MAVNQTHEEKTIAAKVDAELKPLVDAITKAGFTPKVNTYAARFDRGCGGAIHCTTVKLEHWGHHIRIKADWQTGKPTNIYSRVRGERTIKFKGTSIERVVARIQQDLDADIADEKRRQENQSSAQAWFDQAVTDFKGMDFAKGLKTDRSELHHRFERLNRGMHKQKPGTYSVDLDDREIFENLSAAQVIALDNFLKVLPALK